MRVRPATLFVPLLLVGTAACASSDGSTKVTATGTNDACTLADDHLPAGKLAFEFTNRADDVNELYVLRADGTVVAEVENVNTGTTRTLNADLVAGDYQVRCKPGQTGEGFTSDFEVVGSGGTAPAKADRTVQFSAVDFDYAELDPGRIEAGQSIGFEMANEGDQAHEFEVLDPTGEAIGEVASTEPGDTGTAVMTFAEPGRYTYQCILVDPETGKEHTALGMTGSFDVVQAG